MGILDPNNPDQAAYRIQVASLVQYGKGSIAGATDEDVEQAHETWELWKANAEEVKRMKIAEYNAKEGKNG